MDDPIYIIYIYTSQFQPSLPPPLIRIKVFGTKLHRESSIHAGMFFLFFFLVLLQLLSSFSVNYFSLPSHVLLRLVARCYTFRARESDSCVEFCLSLKKRKKRKGEMPMAGSKFSRKTTWRRNGSFFRFQLGSSFDFSFFLFVSWLVEQRCIREGMGEKIGRRSRALI